MIYFPEYYDRLSEECRTLYDRWQNVTSDVNIYDIFGYCYKTEDELAQKSHQRRELAVVGGQPKAYKKYFTA